MPPEPVCFSIILIMVEMNTNRVRAVPAGKEIDEGLVQAVCEFIRELNAK